MSKDDIGGKMSFHLGPRFRLASFLFSPGLSFPLLMFCAILSLPISVFPARAQVSMPSPAGSPPISESEKRETEAAQRIWIAHLKPLQQGKWKETAGELEKLYQWKLDQGIRNHYLYAVALIRECHQVVREGETEVIQGLLGYAEKMAPDFAQVTWARARWLLSQSFPSLENAVNAAREGFHGVFLSLYNLENALPLYANFTLWVLASLILTVVIFSFSLVFKYSIFFAHHLQHVIRLEMSSWVLQVLGFLFLLLPFLLGLGWMWVFTFWLLIFWIYAGRADRIVIATFLVILLLLPAGIRLHSSFVAALTGNGVTEIARANHGTWSASLHQRLLTLNKLNPRDPDILQALGLVEKRMGKFLEAEQHVQEWIASDLNSSAAFNNLGNIHLVANRTDRAIGAYEKSIQLEPTRAEPHYNLGQACLHKFLLKEADSQFRQAKELQPGLISFSTKIFSQNPNRMVIDRTIEPYRLWKRVFADSPNRKKIAQGFWNFLFNGVPMKYGELLGLLLLVLLWLIQGRAGKMPSIRKCEQCGGLICSRCASSWVTGNQCSQCIKTLTLRESEDPHLVEQKWVEIQRYRAGERSRSQWASWLLPGSGHLLRGHSWEGALYLFIFFLFLTKGFFWRGWVPEPLGLDNSLSVPWMVATLILFLFYYGFVQYRMRRIGAARG